MSTIIKKYWVNYIKKLIERCMKKEDNIKGKELQTSDRTTKTHSLKYFSLHIVFF